MIKISLAVKSVAFLFHMRNFRVRLKADPPFISHAETRRESEREICACVTRAFDEFKGSHSVLFGGGDLNAEKGVSRSSDLL